VQSKQQTYASSQTPRRNVEHLLARSVSTQDQEQRTKKWQHD
jgi:hypothetical protein